MGRKLLITCLVAAFIALGSVPAVAMPKDLLLVDVECPSGSQELGFIDNQGSIVGFDEDGNVVQFHRLEGTLALSADVAGVEVFSASDTFTALIGKGKGLKLEHCTFAAVFADFTETVTQELAEFFETEFGTDVLHAYIGQDVTVLSQITGDVWLKTPGR